MSRPWGRNCYWWLRVVDGSRKLRSLFLYQSRLRVGWALLLFAALYIVLDVASFFLVQHPRSLSYRLSPHIKVIDEIRLFLVVLGSVTIAGWAGGTNEWSYGLDGRFPIRRFALGAFGGLTLASLLVWSLVKARYLLVEPAATDFGEIVLYGVEWALAFAFLAAKEELLFRGYLQKTLGRPIGFWPAAVVSSGLFAVVHLTSRVDAWFYVVAAFMAGLVFSLALRESGSLWWGIGFHAAWDWTQAFVYGTPAGGHLLEGTLMQTIPQGDPNWSGGTAGPDASYVVVPVLCLTALIIVSGFKRRRILRLLQAERPAADHRRPEQCPGDADL
jgi:membrane protease YdiL (CAAX protease family)